MVSSMKMTFSNSLCLHCRWCLFHFYKQRMDGPEINKGQNVYKADLIKQLEAYSAKVL